MLVILYVVERNKKNFFIFHKSLSAEFSKSPSSVMKAVPYPDKRESMSAPVVRGEQARHHFLSRTVTLKVLVCDPVGCSPTRNQRLRSTVRK